MTHTISLKHKNQEQQTLNAIVFLQQEAQRQKNHGDLIPRFQQEQEL
ncbi:MAG: hypothetical protein AB4372_15285 [Xenococcus sp. (in: cyanobacteria)]